MSVGRCEQCDEPLDACACDGRAELDLTAAWHVLVGGRRPDARQIAAARWVLDHPDAYGLPVLAAARSILARVSEPRCR